MSSDKTEIFNSGVELKSPLRLLSPYTQLLTRVHIFHKEKFLTSVINLK